MDSRHRDNRSSREARKPSDLSRSFTQFQEQPTWEKYWTLHLSINNTTYDYWKTKDQDLKYLDKLAESLSYKNKKVTVACRAIRLELPAETSFQNAWRNRSFREFGCLLIRFTWGLPSSPRWNSAQRLLRHQQRLSHSLLNARQRLRNGTDALPPLSKVDAEALLVWVQAKKHYDAKVVKLITTLRDTLSRKQERVIEPLFWQELSHLLHPNAKRVEPKPKTQPDEPERRVAIAQEQEPEVETASASPAMKQAKAEPVLENVPSDVSVTAVTEVKAESVLNEALPSETSVGVAEVKAEPVLEELPSGNTPAPVAQSIPPQIQEVPLFLSHWQQAIEEFTEVVSTLTASIEQKDEFIRLLQQQQAQSNEAIQQAREQAQAKVKGVLMRHLAAPLDEFHEMITLYDENEDFLMIYESFCQALAELEIFPVGEIGRQFMVGPNDLVRTEDGQPVVGQQVEQTGLGWQLERSDGTVRPLERARVRRL